MNSDIWFSIATGSLLFFLLCTFLIAFTLLFIKKRKQHEAEKVKLQQRYTQTLLQSQLEIKEQTLQHISRELHDNLGQVASLIKINLNTLPPDLPSVAREKIADTKTLIRQLITDLKGLSRNLSGDRVTHLGIVRCLEIDVERLNKTGKFNCTFSAGEVPELSGSVTVILYRMAQEILNNAMKHSEADKLSVSVDQMNNFLILAVTDNGVGFNVADRMSHGGSGLINLQNRARLINGRFYIESSPGLGTKIRIELPL